MEDFAADGGCPWAFRKKELGHACPAHRFGASKARFFRAIGFAPDQWEVLATALRDHCRRNPVTRETDAGFGPRYQVDGNLI
jgi:hypothetical protein